jgi:hypothetical protein
MAAVVEWLGWRAVFVLSNALVPGAIMATDG